MGYSDVTDRVSVELAIAEFDASGNPEIFLDKYGYKPATSYLLRYNGKTYPPKAILGVAHGYQFPEVGPLKNTEFSGGENSTNRVLLDLGFEVVDASKAIRLLNSIKSVRGTSLSGGRKAPHKALLLLLAIKQVANSSPRLMPIEFWANELQKLFDEFAHGIAQNVDQPIWRLENSIWFLGINGIDQRPNPFGEPNTSVLRDESFRSGLTEDAFGALQDHETRAQAVDLIIENMLSDFSDAQKDKIRKMTLNSTTWWVNQGTTYVDARNSGHVWAPLLQKNGHAASHHAVLGEMAIGDVVIHYSNGSIRAIGLVKGEAEIKPRPTHHPEKEWEGDGRQVAVEYFELDNPIPLATIKRIPSGAGPFNRNGSINQGYMYRLPDRWARDIREQFIGRWPEQSPWAGGEVRMKSTLEGLAEDLMLDVSFLEEIEELLEDKKQVIFYGPPGAGKTYVALKMAEALSSGSEDLNPFEVVQFHPSYAYEDFVEGFRPTEDGTFNLRRGKLLSLADKAIENPDTKFFLIIDEINRGNVAKIFGEMYFLLEYRDKAIHLQYSDEPFKMPENLYFIGTMNSADRSIGLIDSALRRRFHFVSFYPTEKEMKNLLRDWLKSNVPSMAWIADAVDNANYLLDNPDFAIGPSHFMKKNLTDELAEKIWKRSIIPYVQDLYFNRKEEAEKFDLDRVRALKRLAKDYESEDSGVDADSQAS